MRSIISTIQPKEMLLHGLAQRANHPEIGMTGDARIDYI